MRTGGHPEAKGETTQVGRVVGALVPPVHELPCSALIPTRPPPGHIFRTWKKRWFVLDEQLLKYYKAADSAAADARVSESGGAPDKVGDSDMKGCISIQNSKVVALAPADAAGRSFCFQLTPISGKIFLICAADEEGRDAWMEAIKANAEPRQGEAASPAAAAAAAAAEAAEAAEPEPEEVGNVIGKETVTLADFELLKVIGRGTYGKVMQVKRRETGEILAMKVLKKENIFARNDPKALPRDGHAPSTLPRPCVSASPPPPPRPIWRRGPLLCAPHSAA